MRPTPANVPSLLLIAPLAIVASTLPALDLVGDAAWDELRVEVGFNGRTGVVADQDNREIDLMQVAAGAASVSGYRFRTQPRSGWLLGGKLQLSTWFDQDQVLDFTAIAPVASVTTGLWFLVGEKIRLELAPEIGVGVAVAKYRPSPAQDSQTKDSEAFLHYGIHARAIFPMGDHGSLGLDVGYDVDRLPYVESQGPVFGLVIGF